MNTSILLLQTRLLCVAVFGAVVGAIYFCSHYQGLLRSYDVTNTLPLVDRVGTIPIVVHRPPVCKRQRVNIVYVKTHKCATETTRLILYRFAERNKLSTSHPRRGRYTLCYPYPLEARCFNPTRTPMNVIFHHFVFNDDVISRVMPHDTVYITSIRDPFSRMKSAFNYYSIRNRLPNLANFADPLIEYLRDIPKYETMYTSPYYKYYNKCLGRFSFTHNTLAFDLGLPTGFHVNTTDQTNNATYIRHWIDALQRRFSLVIIMEYYDESLVLFRRLMCWKIKDILYMKRNVMHYKDKEKQIDSTYVNNFKRYNQPEYVLYNHFNKTLWRRIDEEPDDFRDELNRFKELLSEATGFCKDAKKKNDVHWFRSSKWNGEFSITAEWCGKKLSLRKARSVADSSVPGC